MLELGANVDWDRLLGTYAPAVGFIYFLLRAHRDIVYKIIPQGLKKITREIIRSRRFQLRLYRELLESECPEELKRRKPARKQKPQPLPRTTTRRKPRKRD